MKAEYQPIFFRLSNYADDILDLWCLELQSSFTSLRFNRYQASAEVIVLILQRRRTTWSEGKLFGVSAWCTPDPEEEKDRILDQDQDELLLEAWVWRRNKFIRNRSVYRNMWEGHIELKLEMDGETNQASAHLAY